jgi:hypothetical protein
MQSRAKTSTVTRRQTTTATPRTSYREHAWLTERITQSTTSSRYHLAHRHKHRLRSRQTYTPAANRRPAQAQADSGKPCGRHPPRHPTQQHPGQAPASLPYADLRCKHKVGGRLPRRDRCTQTALGNAVYSAALVPRSTASHAADCFRPAQQTRLQLQPHPRARPSSVLPSRTRHLLVPASSLLIASSHISLHR